jgi:cell division protein FtsZ
MTEAFVTADDVLRQAIQGISDLILVPGLINLDFADVKTIMSGMGVAMMGTGVADGPDRALAAAKSAISSPLLEDSRVEGARGVIINVTGGPDLGLMEVGEASAVIQEAAHEDANIIFGAVVDPALKGKVKITVIATGFDAAAQPAAVTGAQTPIDMTPYTDQARMRSAGPIAPPPAEPVPAPRFSINRRPLVDLPLSAGILQTPMAAAPAAPGSAPDGAPRLQDAAPDFELSSTFDVPAFLRRQET